MATPHDSNEDGGMNGAVNTRAGSLVLELGFDLVDVLRAIRIQVV
jgi:hypothetical protein